MVRGRHIIRVRLAAAAIVPLGLVGAAAPRRRHRTPGHVRGHAGVPAQARASAPRIPAARPGIATAYVVNAHSDTVAPVAIATNRAGPAIKVGRNRGAIAISPDGKTACVANYVAGTVTPISTATSKAGHAIRTGKTPVAIAITS
jgi:hypothetical protein